MERGFKAAGSDETSDLTESVKAAELMSISVMMQKTLNFPRIAFYSAAISENPGGFAHENGILLFAQNIWVISCPTTITAQHIRNARQSTTTAMLRCCFSRT